VLFSQKAVLFSQNPVGYEKNVAGLAHLSPQTLGVAYSATSGATGSEKNAPENQRVKCRVRQVSPLVDVESFYACPLGMRHGTLPRKK